MFRYVALLWNEDAAQVAATAEDLTRRIQAMSPGWSTVLRATGMAVLAADRSPHMTAEALFGGYGVVLGEIFPRTTSLGDGAADASARFGAKETQAVVESDGRILASHYWGNYVAVILGENRAPA